MFHSYKDTDPFSLHNAIHSVSEVPVPVTVTFFVLTAVNLDYRCGLHRTKMSSGVTQL